MRYSISLLITVFIFCMSTLCWSQCKGDFSYKVFPSEKGKALGKIEVTLGLQQDYTLKVYAISGEIKLVKTEVVNFEKIALIEGLSPSDYIIKIEWGNGCSQTIGGKDGIQIVEKAD